MAVATGGPAGTLRELFRRLDRLDLKGLGALMNDDVQAVDEVSRRWLHGRQDLDAYMAQIEGVMTDIRSELKAVREEVYGEVAIVTCWLEQDYTLQGKPTHISAPTSAVLRRVGGDWKIVLFHSIPLPAE